MAYKRTKRTKSSKSRYVKKRSVLASSETKHFAFDYRLPKTKSVDVIDIIQNHITQGAKSTERIGKSIYITAIRIDIVYDNSTEANKTPMYCSCYLIDNRNVDLPLGESFYKGYGDVPYAPHPFLTTVGAGGTLNDSIIHSTPLYLVGRTVKWRDNIRLHPKPHSDLSGPRYQHRQFYVPVNVKYDIDSSSSVGRKLHLVMMASNPTKIAGSVEGSIECKATIYYKDV